MRCLLTGFLFFLLPFHILQAQNETRRHAWVDLYNYHQLNSRWVYEWDVGLRLLTNDAHWSRYNLRNSITYKLNKYWSFGQGLDFHDWDQNFATRSYELRTYQTIKFAVFLSESFNLSNQFRFEERFFHWQNTSDMQYMGRLRYELSTKIVLNRLKKTTRLMYIPLSEEVMINVGENSSRFPHINRVNAGLGYFLTKSIRAEMLFVMQHTKRITEEKFSATDHLYRLKLRYNWN
ncbi:MAG: DUF2490 domain-containing protein [Candidatus Cyclobacteriaceae bacterium M3_2C_046]